MNTFNALLPLLVPSFSSKGNLLIPTEDGGCQSDNYELLQVLDTRVSRSYLVSAYDIYYGFMPKDPNEWPDTDYLFVDSGGYEINDSYDLSERNRFNYKVYPWDFEKMKEVYHRISSSPKFSNTSIVLSGYDLIDSFTKQLKCVLKLQEEFPKDIVNFIIKITFPFEQLFDEIKGNVNELQKIQIIGLTEKELGNTVKEKLLNLISLKKLLMSLEWNGKIHIFGGLEPSLSKLYYIAGADVFDGLSWQRMRYRTNSTLYDPLSYDISYNEYENKYIMMMDNLMVLQELTNSLACKFDLRTEKMDALEKLIQTDNYIVQNIFDEMEM